MTEAVAPTTLVCFALKEEAAPFRKLARRRPDISVLITGIGRRNAELAVAYSLRKNLAQRVFSCGFAGGLNHGFKTGDIVFATAERPIHLKLEDIGAQPAKFHCVPNMVATAMEKERIRRMTGADAVEMESDAIHAVCRERGIPCATVRVISDAADEDLPLDFNQFITADKRLARGEIALAVLKSPRKIGALLRLQKQSRFAAKKLAEALVKIIPPA